MSESRRARLARRVPVSGRVWIGLVALACVVPFALGDFWLRVGLFSMAAAMIALGLNLLFGTAGQLSLGHGIFVAIGGYGYIVLSAPAGEIGTTAVLGANLPAPLAAVLAVLLAGLAGLLLSPITRRLGGLSLAVATLGLVFVTSHVLANAPSVSGGFNGRPVEPLSVFGIPIGDDSVSTVYAGLEVSGNQQLWFVMLACVVGGAWIAHNIIHSRQGRALQAVRDQQLAAGVLGVEVARYKAQVFFASALYAGLGGVLVALAFGQLVPEYFEVFLSINYVVMVVLGGLNVVGGALIGAVVVTALPEVFTQYSGAIPLVSGAPGQPGIDPGSAARYLYGAAIVAILIAEPDGLVGLGRRVVARFRSGGGERPTGLSPPSPGLSGGGIAAGKGSEPKSEVR